MDNLNILACIVIFLYVHPIVAIIVLHKDLYKRHYETFLWPLIPIFWIVSVESIIWGINSMWRFRKERFIWPSDPVYPLEKYFMKKIERNNKIQRLNRNWRIINHYKPTTIWEN